MFKSVTLLFPGQGSQHVGMGKELEGRPSFNLFKKADDILGYNLSSICFNGPEEQLTLTANTQPALLTHSVAIWQNVKELLDSKGVAVNRVLGHSIGEYSALVAAGALSFEDAVMAVHLRGKFMQEAVPQGKGKMYAIMRASEEKVVEACELASDKSKGEIVTAANFNEPGQTVISGHAAACDRAAKWIEANVDGRTKALELKVSAPFHSPLMEPAANNLAAAFSKFKFLPLKTPYIANINATEYPIETSGDVIRQNLIDQVCGSVQWSKSIAKLDSNTLCLEIGTGRVLAGLVRKINRDIKVLSMEFEDSYTELKGMI
ncbi:MAG: [acyl-carrier-protein] S-malonyltransferase [Bdellovibrionales bacterium RIFOXYD12_FULL_39_22]|nr:MAG: [acyl-carrier-protein] S-malonyltransferase [Bdellovibrionales bacterium RIFOXYB1_FULL_39_21]OFZ42995.1 MAG: [acyl-carrier-protein] S-malonyltransferase [Bdellovibrionales bacterium RIFOXYC12_FULL_39_17]OFZ50919.1 MAG: [acyl-carrier-protein] S-malonyltransferase [Bdellovibrionales bacterium RIFOXYC1_FULL_39_130]OFZ78142.1 MAG: [acyl-carrier-protein] S-malonyltransferase [Bdellovibrionales bacterium RIFOXYD1_FULL_39_84]OFZ94010.1 MAG: [acyl-carrier-protein] S-malonyltransferase [Bdellovi